MSAREAGVRITPSEHHPTPPPLLLHSIKATFSWLKTSVALPTATMDILCILMTLVIIPAGGLRVFDCSHPKTSFQAIDLLEPQPCPDPHTDYALEDFTMIQVLQTDTAFPVVGYQCKVIISKEVTRCGFDSVDYGSEWPIWQQTLELTPQECRQAVKEKSIKVENRQFRINLGRLDTHTYFSHGNRDTNGYCLTATFTTNGVTYTRSYEKSIIDVHFKTTRGTADLSTGQVVFTNGLRTNYKDEVLRDATEGTIVWTGDTPDCKTTVSEVYLGNSTIHRRTDKGDYDAIVMIADNTTRQYAGLQLREPQSVCGLHCHGTQIKGLVGCLLRPHDTPLPQAQFKSYFDPTIANIQTQLAFLHLGSNFAMYSRFDALQQGLCNVDRRSMFNKIQAISGANNQYALLDIYGPGHKIYVAGASAYVTRCHPRDAVRADFPNCTVEVPVSINETRRFADPYTWTLSDIPTIIPCDDVMPIRWRINELWFCATPTTHRCPAPLQMNVTNSKYLRHEDFTEGLGSGIFTEEQLAQHRAYEVSMASRLPVVAGLTNTMTRNGLEHTLGIPLSEKDLYGIRIDVASMIFPLVHWFGELWTYFSGFLLLLLSFKVLVNMILRSIVLYTERGCGKWMVAACWDTAFLIIRTPWTVIKTAGNTLIDPLPPTDTEMAARGHTYQELQQHILDQKYEMEQLQFKMDAYFRTNRDTITNRETATRDWPANHGGDGASASAPKEFGEEAIVQRRAAPNFYATQGHSFNSDQETVEFRDGANAAYHMLHHAALEDCEDQQPPPALRAHSTGHKNWPHQH